MVSKDNSDGSGMPSVLEGKVVLITGGARRVGAAICRRLHASGAQVVIHYRASAAESRALEAELNAQRPASAARLQADLLKVAALGGLVKETVRIFGRLDAVVNNASSFYPTPVGEINEQVFDDLVGTNLKAPLFLVQAAARELRRNHGCVVNIVDIHAEVPMKSHVVYNAAKGGLLALTRSLARELGPEVRVNGIAPGPVLWPEGQSDTSTRAKIIERTILKRMGTPADIARTALFFAAHAPFITGQILAVDGGRSVAW